MSANESRQKGNRQVSVFNWILTLLACSIPIVNIVVYILFIIFARLRSKRRFAIAGLVLEILFLLAIAALFIFLPDTMREFGAWLRSIAPPEQ